MLAENYNLKLFYFTRKQYQINLDGFPHDGQFLGEMENRKYHKRILLVLKLLFKIISDKNKNIYCTSVEQALIACLVGKKVILELGDLRQLDRDSRVLRTLDAYLLKRLSGLVVTSPHFLTNYFSVFRHYDSAKAFVAENKLPHQIKVAIDDYRTKYCSYTLGEKKRIGLIGSIRYPEALERLRSVLLARSDLELHVFGDGYLSIFQNMPNCIVHGPFKNPDDLFHMYSQIHVNMIIYNTNNRNVQLALPNKLYESLAFLRPIVCASDCALADLVHDLGIGISSDLTDLDQAIDLAFDNYAKLTDNIRSLPANYYLDEDKDRFYTFIEDSFCHS